MAKWWEKSGKKEAEVPAELRDLTDEQLVERVKKAAELETKVTALEADKTALQTNVTNLNTEFTSTKERLAALEASSRKAPITAGEPTSFLDDEDKAFNERAQPLLATTLHAGAMAAQSVFLQNLTPTRKRLFLKYKAEVDGVMKNEPAQNKIMPERWDAALTYVLGMHVEDIAKTHGSDDDPFAEGSSTSAGSHTAILGAGGEGNGDVKLTDAQKAVCAKMGVSEADYAKTLKGAKIEQ